MDELVRGLLKLSETEPVSILDSCGVGHLGSHLLIAGLRGDRMVSPDLDGLAAGDRPSIFTLSYGFGARLNGVESHADEPEVFAAKFDSLIVHDYATGQTEVVGASDGSVLDEIRNAAGLFEVSNNAQRRRARSNFSRTDYIAAIDAIQERIRCGDTYQTNLTQQISLETGDMRPQDVFWRLRRDHPAAFAAFIVRNDSAVVSASPERFVRVNGNDRRHIETSPIKGTRRRGETPEEDAQLRRDLLNSPKDRAENTMIVDLLRNDLGRVCEYGSVRVDRLCELEEHPTLFHLVSTVSGELRNDATFANIVESLFPCGSITGAPKISTMRIIEDLEPSPRGLSMGAIGYSIPKGFGGIEPAIDSSVAIRTIVFRDRIATFNVGGGVTTESDPDQEYEESLLKAKALLSALNADL